MAELDAEDCMDTQSNFHMRKSYVLKSQNHNPVTPKYKEDLLVENTDE